MEELGRESERLHCELGKSLPLRSVDRVVLVGESSRPVGEGIENPNMVQFYHRAEEARHTVDSFIGAIFVQGSREHGLETLLPGRVEDQSKAG